MIEIENNSPSKISVVFPIQNSDDLSERDKRQCQRVERKLEQIFEEKLEKQENGCNSQGEKI